MPNAPSQDDVSADIAIVGGGSSGALLAARLSRDPCCSVLLIEAGEEPNDPDIWHPAAWPALQGRSFDRDYRTVAQPGTAGRVHRWARGRLIGGSSCLHAMGYMRGHPQDFRAWVRATGDPGWGWDALDAVFRANEQPGDHSAEPAGESGPLPLHLPDRELSPLTRAFLDTGVALGLPRLPHHNGGEMIGMTPNMLNIRDGRRVTAADAWLTAEVRARANLRILTGTEARRLIPAANAARLIEARGPQGPLSIRADRVILCAGAIDTPALLMRSGIGPAKVLKAASVDCLIDMAEIGRNLQDHLLGAANLYASRRPLPPSRLQHSESMAYMRADSFTDTGQPEIVVGCGVAPIVSERLSAPEPGAAYSLLFGVTHPTSRGHLAITGPDPADPLHIDPAYLSTAHDRDLFRKALRAARAIGHAQGMADWRKHEIHPEPPETQAAIDAFIARAAITHHHPCGTCRMGNDDASVVLPSLRLRSLDNVFVADASVMPSLTAGPIHAAVLAIAGKLAASLGP